METNGCGPTVFDRAKENRKPSGRGGAGKGLSVDDGDAFPNLVQILATLPKGATKAAKTGRVAFYLYNGRLSCAVNIPAMRTCGYYTLEGFADAFARLEGALADGRVDWREDA